MRRLNEVIDRGEPAARRTDQHITGGKRRPGGDAGESRRRECVAREQATTKHAFYETDMGGKPQGPCELRLAVSRDS